METEQATILVVDDQPANLKVLFTLFKQYDFDIRIAENGELALEMLEEILPDIILLDVMMPGKNGFEICRQIKENPATSSIPIIFMTALDSLEDKVAAFTAGGVDYITKPFEQIEVMARVNTHITLRRQQLELEKALAEVKKLSGFLPICSFCKKIRDDKGYWQQLEKYIDEHSEAKFSHGMCPECMEEHYGDLLREMENEK
ncbi:MAG: response regulator [Deltaproteobacteria bacterium]|nr:response regulator [Candidatus Tharpella sp.]